MDDGGGKCVVLTARSGPSAAGADADGDDGDGDAVGRPGGPGAPEATGVTQALARLVGLHPTALAVGVPVPLAHRLRTWSDVRHELATDRWDLVVLRVRPGAAADLVQAPDLLLRVLDARLDAMAPTVGSDPGDAVLTADLLALRPELLAARAVAEAACSAGHPAQHDGCDRPGALGLATVDAHDPTGRSVPAVAVRADGDGFVWQVAVPAGSEPEVWHQRDRLAVRVGDQRRTFRLAPALTRCRVRAARVVAGRLEVRLDPDPDAWR